MSSTPSIGFGKLNGPPRAVEGSDGPKDIIEGDVLSDGTVVRPTPTDTSLTIAVLSLTSTTIEDGNGVLSANVNATWSVPSQGESETDPNGVKNYEISYSIGTGPGWTDNRSTEVRDVTIRGLPVERIVDVRVRAVTGKGKRGPWKVADVLTARDNTPPPVPTKPTLKGTVRGAAVRWDGAFAGNEPVPDDFRHVIAEMSLDPAFPPSSIIQAGFLPEAGQTAVSPVGTGPFTIYGRLVSIDHSGNRSVPSEVASTTSIQALPEDIGQGAITTAKLADLAVNAEKVLNGAISSLKLGDLSVTVDKLGDLSVATGKIVDAAIDQFKLRDDSVGSTKIVDGAVVTNKLAALAVNSTKLAEAAVTTSKITNNAITNLQLASGSVTTDTVAQNAITTELLAQFAVKAQNVGFGIGGANQLLNSSFEDGLTGWGADVHISLASVTGSLVHGTMSLETTFTTSVGQQPALTP